MLTEFMCLLCAATAAGCGCEKPDDLVVPGMPAYLGHRTFKNGRITHCLLMVSYVKEEVVCDSPVSLYIFTLHVTNVLTQIRKELLADPSTAMRFLLSLVKLIIAQHELLGLTNHDVKEVYYIQYCVGPNVVMQDNVTVGIDDKKNLTFMIIDHSCSQLLDRPQWQHHQQVHVRHPSTGTLVS